MKSELFVQSDLSIPESELEITTSRAGGPGGQHVNKTETRVTVRWNVTTSCVLTEEQKKRVLSKLASKLSSEGDLIISSAASRSQQHNKERALEILAQEIRHALLVPKKRLKTKVTKAAKEVRLQSKSKRSNLKKMRSKKGYED